jgi:ribonuclease D
MNEAVELVRDPEGVRSLVGAIGGGPVALDTEADSFHRYHEKVCLIQLSFGGRDALVDPLEGGDPRPLGPLVASPGIRKVLHGADYDLRILNRDFGFEFSGLFDTQPAARLLGERAFGLAALLESYLGVRLDKRQQLADWSRRPLTPQMQAYAAEDTRHLLQLAEVLERELVRAGRLAWAQEEFRRLEALRWREERNGEPWRRIKGISRLDRRSLAVVRALHAVRDSEARDRDRPVFRILRDEVLIELARRRPARQEDLLAIPGFPRSRAAGPQATRWLTAVAEAMDLPEQALPEVQRGVRVRPNPIRESRVKALQAKRDALAARLGVDPSLVATRAMLEAAVDLRERGEGLENAPDLRDWQRELLEPLLE